MASTAAAVANTFTSTEGFKETVKNTAEKTLNPVKFVKSAGEGGSFLSGSKQALKEKKQSIAAQEADAEKERLRRREAAGTSALASAEDVSRRLASDPTAQISGEVEAGDPRAGVFKQLAEGIERRRAQILQSRRQPGRKSTILSR